MSSAAQAQAGPATQQAAATSDRFYPARRALEAVAAPVAALLLAAVAFSLFLLLLGKSPGDFFLPDLEGRVRQLVLVAEHACSVPRRCC